MVPNSLKSDTYCKRYSNSKLRGFYWPTPYISECRHAKQDVSEGHVMVYIRIRYLLEPRIGISKIYAGMQGRKQDVSEITYRETFTYSISAGTSERHFKKYARKQGRKQDVSKSHVTDTVTYSISAGTSER